MAEIKHWNCIQRVVIFALVYGRTQHIFSSDYYLLSNWGTYLKNASQSKIAVPCLAISVSAYMCCNSWNYYLCAFLRCCFLRVTCDFVWELCHFFTSWTCLVSVTIPAHTSGFTLLFPHTVIHPIVLSLRLLLLLIVIGTPEPCKKCCNCCTFNLNCFDTDIFYSVNDLEMFEAAQCQFNRFLSLSRSPWRGT